MKAQPKSNHKKAPKNPEESKTASNPAKVALWLLALMPATTALVFLMMAAASTAAIALAFTCTIITMFATIAVLATIMALTLWPLTKLFTKPTTNKSEKNKIKTTAPKQTKRNPPGSLRQWKITQQTSWYISKHYIKILSLTAALLCVVENLHKEDLNKKLYSLAHNKRFTNEKGNAFPIKQDTMLKDRKKISGVLKREHRKQRKLKHTARHGLQHVLNLRFLPNSVKTTITNLMAAWRFLSNHTQIYPMHNTAKGPRTLCPMCTIPAIGAFKYLDQNFRNMTNAIITAAKNFSIEQTTTTILELSIGLMVTIGVYLLFPFRKMNIGRPKPPNKQEIPKSKHKYMGQLDGNDDLEYTSSENEDENSFTAHTEEREGNYGWIKKPTEKYPKGIGYWYNWKRPKNKYSKLEHAPKMNPPKITQSDPPQKDDIQGDHIENEEEINITMSETIRTKIVNINVRSAVSLYKQAQIREGIRNIDPDVIAITESWFNEYDQEFGIENYVTIGRQDRPPPPNKDPSNKKRGGGVLVLAKKDLAKNDIKHVHEVSLHKDCQIIRFVLDNITVYVIYRTGKNDVTHTLLTKWLDSEISKLNEKPYIITGDLNLPELAKVNFDPKLTAVGTDRQRKTKEHMWTELVKKHRIEQLVNEPTQRKGNILDYIFVPEHVNIPFIKVDRSAFCANFDHFAVIFEVDAYYQRKREEMYIRKETNETWKRFHELLRVTDFMGHLRKLQETLKGKELIDEMSNYIVSTLKKIYEEATPNILTKPPPIGGFLSRTTIRQIAHAKRLYRTMVKTLDDEKKPRIREKLRILNKSNKWLIRQDRIAWEFRRLHLSKERGDNFFRFMSEITRKTKTIGPIIAKDGKLKSSDSDMAKAFNDFLCDLMKPSSTTTHDWDTTHEPKERQLHVCGMTGSDTRHPMDSNNTREQIYNTHKELAPFGYELTVEDIIDGYPLGTQARGRKNIPVVITYKDTSTKEKVKLASMKAGLWNRRIENNNETKDSSVTGWVINLAKKLSATIKSLLLNLDEKKPNKPCTYFTAAFDTMDSIIMNTNEIKEAIKKTKRTSAAGPDGLRMAVYTEACNHILKPLQTLFNTINSSGNIPTNFKTARVIMIHKKNTKQDMGNYRPISMENHIAKIWERVLNARLMIHLNRHNRLTRRQHGFRPKRGCHTNLFEAQEKIIRQTDIHGPVIETWSFDLQKAFDLLDHGKALNLCHKAGINGKVGRCIENWLTHRHQYVQCGKDCSDPRQVNRSCIQGSVLGPTMWLIYVQSLLDRLEDENCDHYAYADDVAIVAKISTAAEITRFNDILNALLKWGRDYEMTWGAHKTQRLAIRYQNCGAGKPPEMFFDGKKIMATDKIESLGMYLDATGVPSAQHERVEKDIKVMRILVAKNYKIRTQAILEKLYTAYILPKINYCSQMYHTGKATHLKGIKKELKNFWRLCDTKIAPLNVMSVETQLIFNDLKFMHKMKHGNSPIDFDEYFVISDIEKTGGEKIEAKPYKRGTCKAFANLIFTQRIAKYWNFLPKNIRNLKIGPFKEKIKEILTDEKKKRHRQKLLNFGLDTNINGGAPHGIYE